MGYRTTSVVLYSGCLLVLRVRNLNKPISCNGGGDLKREYALRGVPKLPFANSKFAQVVVGRVNTAGLDPYPTGVRTWLLL